MRAHRETILRLLLALMLAGVAAPASGCPKRFDPAAKPSLPRGGDPTARARFQSAQRAFENDEWQAAGAEFEAIATAYPDDPIAPQATLYAGAAAYRQGLHAEAIEKLEPLVESESAGEEVRRRARFWLGLAYAGAGRHGAARDLLLPFDGKLEAGDEAVELDAALAAAFDGLGEPARALPYYDRFFRHARPAERKHVATRVAALVEALPESELDAAYGRADKRGPAGAFVGARLALRACAAGDSKRAARILDETGDAREAVGLPRVSGCEAGGGDDGANPGLVGAVLPLSGKRRLVGEALLRGVTVIAGLFDDSAGRGVAEEGRPRPFAVLVRDAGESAELAGAAVAELVAAGAIAVIGPADRDAAKVAAEKAEALGVPLISLDVGDGALAPGSPHVFRLVLPVETRARALARAAYTAGARDFALLVPEIAYGERAAQAFRDEVAKLGGKVVVEVGYAKNATSFVDPVKKLAKVDFHALFVPDTAGRLELIAPQLAALDLVVAPPGAKKPKRGRNVILLSTAEALSPKFLRGSGRYSVGALFAPGFYPDDTDPRIGPFVTKHRAAYGEDPTYLDAYGHDAALCVRAAVESGASGRAGVASRLASQTVPGLTGDIRFGDDRGRADAGFIFQVVIEAGAPVIRVYSR